MSRVPAEDSCLHLVARASAEVVERCASFVQQGDDVLFIDDGVMCLVSHSTGAAGAVIANGLYLVSDLDARGVAEIAEQRGVRCSGDRELAGLLAKHASCLTWK